jgi:predicted histone-like DNA-binding protein
MITFKLVQNLNKFIEKAYLKWYARPVVEETIDIDGLAEHMANHNSPYSKGVLVGIITDMVSCIKEQLLEGKSVRIDDLAIFSVGISNKKGAVSKEEFTVSNNIEGVKLRARATGELSTSQLNLDAVLKRAALDKANDSTGDDDGDDTPTTGSGTSGSGTSGSGTSGSGTSGNGSGSNSSSGTNKDDDGPTADGML